jgi:hypothetical protein
MTIEATTLRELRDQLNRLAEIKDTSLFVPWDVSILFHLPDKREEITIFIDVNEVTVELSLA